MRARLVAGLVVAAAVVGNVLIGGVGAAAAVCAAPSVSVTGARQYEGSDGGSKTVTLTVTMSPPAAGCPASGSVQYQTVNGSAVAGQDYTTRTARLSWTTAGSQSIPVQVTRDDTYEQDEFFTVELSAPRGVTIGTDSATATILNDDAGPSDNGLIVAIPAGGICWWPSEQCRIRVQLDTIALAAVSVDLRTVDGTAIGGKDYVPIKKLIVTIPAGRSYVDVPVELMAGASPGEHFVVEIAGPTAGTVVVGAGKFTFQED
jgi:hypothetical protein